MKKTVFLGALTVAGLAAGAAAAGTLDDVKARGTLNCGVTTGLVGFAAPDANGEWGGFDVAVCRAVAAAVLGDPKAVEFVPTTGKTRFTALASGEVDMLARNTTWTFSRDVDLEVSTFVGVNYYDGQGFMVPKSLGVTSAKELERCHRLHPDRHHDRAQPGRLLPGQWHELRAGSDRDQRRSPAEVPGRTLVTSTRRTPRVLAATRASFENPGDHVVLPEIVSKEPLGPLVRHGDNQWGDVVRWTLNALITAEELGVTSSQHG